MSSKSRSYAAATIALLTSNAVFAQAPPVVIITFGGPSPVPLDMWSSVGAGLLIASAAYAFFRRRGFARFGRLSAWLAVVAAATGTIMMASRLDLIGAAEAVIGPTQVLLTSSPANVAVGPGSTLLEVHNGTGATVRINSITLQNPAPGQQIVEVEGPNCFPGLSLPVEALCFIGVQQIEM
jgi:hypothetical protein